MSPKGIARFLKYATIGFGTFLLDLLLLGILKQQWGIDPVFAAGGSFLFAVSLNYLLSRRFVFSESTRPHRSGYSYFILIAGTGLLFVMVGMHLLVDVFAVYYIVARISIAGITGIWNYTMNLFFNFKVV